MEGVLWQLPLAATDANGDTLTYHLVGAVPTGLTLNATSGLLAWSPTESQAPGQYTVTVEVRDSGAPRLLIGVPLRSRPSKSTIHRNGVDCPIVQLKMACS